MLTHGLRIAWLAPVAAAAALLLAACGGSGHPAQSGGQSLSGKSLTAADVEKYPDCMRAHGVTNFPDPVVSGNSVKIQINPSITDAPAYQSALKACGHLFPGAEPGLASLSQAQRQARQAGLLAFATCVRHHGFPTFPDPTSQGELSITMITQAGINLQQPAVLRAGDACVPDSHGQITKADVARAVSGGGPGSQSSGGG